MTPSELQKLREKKKISLLDLAARTGLPEDYIAKIEDGLVPALESDLKRLHKALLQAEQEKQKDDKDDYDDEDEKKIDFDSIDW